MKTITLIVTVVAILAYVAGTAALAVTTQASATRMAVLKALSEK